MACRHSSTPRCGRGRRRQEGRGADGRGEAHARRGLPDRSRLRMPPAQANEWSNAWGPGRDRRRRPSSTICAPTSAAASRWTTGSSASPACAKRCTISKPRAICRARSPAPRSPLQPLQFPHRPDIPWLGLDFPETDSRRRAVRDRRGQAALHRALRRGLRRHAAPGGPAARRMDRGDPGAGPRTPASPSTSTGRTPSRRRRCCWRCRRNITGGWRWQDLVDTVHETMDLAKKRAIEPDHIDTHGLCALPAGDRSRR